MRPEISALIRELTYPELVDADSTHNRPDIHGLQDNIVFINHDCPEGDENGIADRRDMSSTTSKHNFFEVHMILKIVRYLGQQGYGTEDLVILTPYLGQLQKIRQALKKDNDPILNDLDSYELIRAGLFNPGEASMNKKPIRLATIGEYLRVMICFRIFVLMVTLSRQLPGGRSRHRRDLVDAEQCERRYRFHDLI